MTSPLENPDSGTVFSQKKQTGSIQSVSFSPDGRMVASGSTDGTIKLWDVITGDEIPLHLTGHSKTVNSLAFSPDGAMLLAIIGPCVLERDLIQAQYPPKPYIRPFILMVSGIPSFIDSITQLSILFLKRC